MTLVHYKENEVSELVDLVRQGNKTAFGALYDRYVNTVYNKCLSFTKDRDEAEDITQDIFVKVFEKIHDFDNRSFGAWLMRITYNQCVDYSRKASKMKHVRDMVDNLEIEDVDENIEAELMEIKLNALEEILKIIDPNDRAILILKYQEDRKIKDIAELFNIGESAVKMRLSRARIQIMEIYRTDYNGGQ